MSDPFIRFFAKKYLFLIAIVLASSQVAIARPSQQQYEDFWN